MKKKQRMKTDENKNAPNYRYSLAEKAPTVQILFLCSLTKIPSNSAEVPGLTFPCNQIDQYPNGHHRAYTQ